MLYHITYEKSGEIHTGRISIVRKVGESASACRSRAIQAASFKFGVTSNQITSTVALPLSATGVGRTKSFAPSEDITVRRKRAERTAG